MAAVEDDIVAAGAEIIWVLEQDQRLNPGTASRCRDDLQALGAGTGWCVGDSETQPEAGVFDESPFSVARGFDIIVPRSTMRIAYETSHGTPSGNDNLTGADVLAKVREIVSEL